MKTCSPSCQWPAYASLPHLPRRSAAAAQPCAACHYTRPLAYAAGPGLVQP